MYKKILLIFILVYLYSQLGFSAILPNYDKLAITPTTWQEVDLKAYDHIKGKRYPVEIKLLRPISWLKANHLDKVGNKEILSLPDFGIKKMYVTIEAIKPTKLDTSKINWSKQSSYPVIGTFKRYAAIVKTYTFKDLITGKISKVTSTPGHKYYVRNRTVNNIIGNDTHYISISRVKSDDILLSQIGDKIKLVCPTNKTSHCGKLYNTGHKPINVYNLEIYNKHRYFVGKNFILVHNIGCALNEIKRKVDQINNYSGDHDLIPILDNGVNCLECSIATYKTFSTVNRELVFPRKSSYLIFKQLKINLKLTESEWMSADEVPGFILKNSKHAIIRGEFSPNVLSGINLSARIGGHFFNAHEIDNYWYLIDSYRNQVSRNFMDIFYSKNSNGIPYYTGRFKVYY
ncbi:hypothetical protein [Francisella sp. 19X1-34]|uniref:hypothetical protein n=1 Tax=Francisella sp. 19X1-34 TaxID=3087177 RepID=UPI002E2FAB5E|nr:hypothetical protein [Francisella sp. 19X1-34]MED7789695.1 hypothetical protein [Francisella sp. 19X1-34]